MTGTRRRSKRKIQERERLALRNKAKKEKQKEAVRDIQGVEGRYWNENVSERPNGLREKAETAFRVGDLDLPERIKRYTRSREEDVAAIMCPCGTTIQSRAHIVGECEIYKEERDALEEMKKLDVCDMEEFGRLESSEKTIAILGDRWWPQSAKQDGDKIGKQFLCSIWKKRNERSNVGGVTIRSRNGAPSRKGCVVNGQITKARNK